MASEAPAEERLFNLILALVASRNGLTKADILETVGGYSGWIAGTGRVIDLAPGESASVGIIFGTASTREDLGYVLPPGRYWLRVQMRLHHGPGAPLTVTPATPRSGSTREM